MTKLVDYLFKTNINSVYQVFWVTHDMSEICSQIELNFQFDENKNYILSIKNSNITLDQIKLIFIQNQIEFEVVTEIQIS